jgi:hypothetical protein
MSWTLEALLPVIAPSVTSNTIGRPSVDASIELCVPLHVDGSLHRPAVMGGVAVASRRQGQLDQPSRSG